MLKYFRCSTSKEIQRFVYNGTNLSPVWSRMNAAWYLWWSTHKPTTVSLPHHPMKEHTTTLTIIVTFTFRILFWLLLVLCSHGCRLASRKRSSLERYPPSEGSSRHILDRMPGSRNYWSEPASSLMIHLPFLLLWGCFRQSRLRKQLFPRKTRVEGGSPVGQLKTTEAASLKGAPTAEGMD